MDEVCGCVRWPKPFDYDEKLIPPEPNFFTTGFLMDKEDRYKITQNNFVVFEICLVTLFDRKHHASKHSSKLIIFGILLNFCPLKI